MPVLRILAMYRVKAITHAMVGSSTVLAILQAIAVPEASFFERWLTPALVIAFGTWMVKKVGGPVSREQLRALMNHPDLAGDEQRRVAKFYEARVQKQEDYWHRIELLEGRTEGMARVIANYSEIAKTQTIMQESARQLTETNRTLVEKSQETAEQVAGILGRLESWDDNEGRRRTLRHHDERDRKPT